jgi:uncharacterized protein (DUF2252 family)
VLAAQEAGRVPELLPIRRERMAASPLAFLAGAAAAMAADLAPLPRTGLTVQLSGDAHLGNFGTFAAPDRRLVFGVDDFDETLPGPFEWDVMRLVASFAVAARTYGHGKGAARRAAEAYRTSIRKLAGMKTLEVWYARLEIDEITDRWGRQAGLHSLERPRTELDAFEKLTTGSAGERRLVSNPPLVVPVAELDPSGSLERRIKDVFGSYRDGLTDDRRQVLERFSYADAARKVVGIGSVGTRTWMLMLLGRDEEDALFLQLKEAGPSVLEAHLGPSGFANHGQRVVVGQRLTQAAPDLLIGWTGDYYVRQLWDGKARADPAHMDRTTLALYAEVCAWALAHAHARSGDPVAIGSYLGHADDFDEALEEFAERYAVQNEADYNYFASR